jgi:hypothetical protein
MEKKEKDNLTRMNVPVSKELHAEVKYWATMRNMKIADFVGMAVSQWIQRERLSQ